MPPTFFRDPWAKADAWRKHPVFSSTAMYRNMFPGFGLGLAAFAVYVTWDTFTAKRKPVSDEPHH